MREKTRADNERDTPVERDWIAAAREMLIEGGISAVQISPLAGRLGVTRGGFYWRFKNRQDLLDQLLLDWESSNARHFLNRLAEAGTPRERMDRLIDLWMEERQFDPRLEATIRQWALIDEPVRKRVRIVDLGRISAIAGILLQAGFDAIQAEARARLTYFHQIGYYTLDLGESAQERFAMRPHYTSVLFGYD
ncbi:TetR/AcrR family transcriptional regulator [Sphingorhabdus sp.]|jgi:AcrR family transcriptional regulator|uniref:TetR/AcrR family transcriptional regulator n=1 Tax=Sphingorhabdus sp. TaxID=1902408 RepID=UPI0037C54027